MQEGFADNMCKLCSAEQRQECGAVSTNARASGVRLDQVVRQSKSDPKRRGMDMVADSKHKECDGKSSVHTP